MKKGLFDKIVKKLKKELKDFGKRPIEDVGAVVNEIQQYHGVKEGEVMKAAQQLYEKLCQTIRKMDKVKAHNSWRTASGNNFEDLMRNFLNDNLNEKGIIAMKGDILKKSKSKEAQEIVKFLTLPARRRCVQRNTGVWPDSDIVLLTREKDGRVRVFGLINCKTSDHSRNTAVCFWALALRDLGIKYVLATQDLDNRFVKGCNEGSNLRRLCEAYLDRVYSTNPATAECAQVKKLDFRKKNGAKALLQDVLEWRDSLVSNADKTLFNEI